jgi:hypothetical protein
VVWEPGESCRGARFIKASDLFNKASFTMTQPKSILNGIGGLVDEWLELDFKANRPLYGHKTAALQLAKRDTVVPATEFMQRAYARIESNWLTAVSENRYSHSSQNWRFTPHPDIAGHHKGPEVSLERAIIRGADEDWANQVPTSSGLVGPAGDKVRNVDLVQRHDRSHYSLIELKVGSDTPLYAAVEILLYGLLLAWSRNNQDALAYDTSKQPVLLADAVDLEVLAPAEYYTRYRLEKLSNAISEGLDSCQDMLGLQSTFRFTQFPADFSLEDSEECLYQKAAGRILVYSV